MLVELDIFSGRPNPEWQLDEAAAGEVRRRLAALSPSPARAASPPGLGYRGFLCTESGVTWRVFKGMLIRRNEVLADPGMTIERFLLEGLPAEYASLRQRIAQELS
jgi:hypothetical protein